MRYDRTIRQPICVIGNESVMRNLVRYIKLFLMGQHKLVRRNEALCTYIEELHVSHIDELRQYRKKIYALEDKISMLEKLRRNDPDAYATLK